MKNTNLTGGLFDMRGKPQPLALSAKAAKITTSEKNIQTSFIAWRDVHKRQFPILNSIFSVPNGAMMSSKAVAISQINQGLTKGISDCICLAPSHDGRHHALLIEFKTEVGRLSPEQVFFQDFFRCLGYRAEVCRSAYAASNLVNEHLNLKIPVYPR